MKRSQSTTSVFRKPAPSPTFQSFLCDVEHSTPAQKSKLYSIACYYDAVPYLQHCRERRCAVRDEDGPMALIFNVFSDAVEPMRQENNSKLTFEQINDANHTICLLELLMFCDFWGITSTALLSRFEISALLKITLKLYPKLNRGVLNSVAFCDMMTYLSILCFSRPPLASARVSTSSMKIQAFITLFRLNDMMFVKSKLSIPKCQWKHINVRTRELSKQNIGKVHITSMTRIPSTNQGVLAKHDSRSSMAILDNTTQLMTAETKQQLMSVSNHHFLKYRHLLRQNVKSDWRRYRGQLLNMRCLRFSENARGQRYKFKIAILNCASQHIRIDISCESELFHVRVNGGFFANGMSKSVFVETVPNSEINAFQDHERCCALTINAMSRKGKSLWSRRIPIHYRIAITSGDPLQCFLPKSQVLPVCVTPLTFSR